MKTTKQKIKEAILETLQEVQDADPTKIKSRTMSTSARVKGSRERIKSTDTEFTSQEKGIVDQLEKFISDLAAKPGVDLMSYRPLLQRVLKLLQKQTEKSVKQPQQGETQ